MTSSDRLCRLTGHTWYSLAYPPRRVDRCEKCGVIREEACRTQVKKSA